MAFAVAAVEIGCRGLNLARRTILVVSRNRIIEERTNETLSSPTNPYLLTAVGVMRNRKVTFLQPLADSCK